MNLTLRRAIRIIVWAIAMSAAGCCTQCSVAPEHMKGLGVVGADGEFVEHYHIRNSGWYLFDKIPLVCGDTNPNSLCGIAFFSDQVRTDTMTRIFNDRVRATDTKPAHVATIVDDGVTVEIPGVSFPLILPYIICYREVQISGVLVRKKEALNEAP